MSSPGDLGVAGPVKGSDLLLLSCLPGSKTRKIPYPTKNPFTWLFLLVSCPNYTYEVRGFPALAALGLGCHVVPEEEGMAGLGPHPTAPFLGLPVPVGSHHLLLSCASPHRWGPGSVSPS